MKIADVRRKAMDLGLKTGRTSKADLIRAIQRAEGNFPCFGTATDYCDQERCCFREDCF
ncbi:MAG: SAP domain-containing protein [Candidatus Hydrothermarchaeales archaeon]